MRTVAAEATSSIWRKTLSRRRSLAISAIAAGVVGILLGIVIGGSGSPEAGLFVAVLGLVMAGVFFMMASRATPDERVVSVYKVHWPLVAYPVEGKTVLYDSTGAVVPKRTVHHEALRDPARLNDLTAELASVLDQLEVLEPEDEQDSLSGVQLFGVDARLARLLESVRKVLGDTIERTIDLPAFSASDPLVRYLASAYGKMTPPRTGGGSSRGRRDGQLTRWHFEPAQLTKVFPVEPELEIARVNAGIEGVYEESGSQERFDIDDTLLALQEEIENLMGELEEAHRESLNVIERAHALASHTTAWPALAFYCPSCNLPKENEKPKELAAATRLREDPETGALYCPQCNKPYPEDQVILLLRHRDETFYPAFDQMLLSIREEILRIDRDVENQLVQLEKERRVKLQEARMQVAQERRKRVAQLRQYKSRARGLAEQVAGMTGALARYEKIQRAQAIQFTEDCNRIAAEVSRKAEQAVAIIEQQAQARARAAEDESLEIAKIARAEEEARHKEIVQLQEAILTANMLTEDQKRDVQSANPFRRRRALRSARGGASGVKG